MAPAWRSRLLALAASCAVAGLMLWGGLHWLVSREPQPLELKRAIPPPPARLAASSELSEAFGQPPLPSRPEDWVFYLPEDLAGRFFSLGESSHYDPWTCSRPNPVRDQRMHWREHPAGTVCTNVNSQGCREDHELSDPPRNLRVLVAGDSHTFGVCDDKEVLTERLEVELRARRPGRSVEVLNAASGGYTFLNYLGTWFRFREFHPQVFLVVVFAGNDFGELMALRLHFTGHPWPVDRAERVAEREPMLERQACAMGQGLDSIESAREWPEEYDRNVRDAVYLCREMQRSASAGGAKMVVAFLPSPFLLRWPAGQQPGEWAIASLGLQPADFERQAKQDREFLAGVREAGIEVLDLTSTFAAEPVPPYWRRDQHLSTRGHELVAETLLPVIDRLLPR